LLTEGADALAAAGIERPRSEVRLLLQHATGLGRARLLADDLAVVAASDAERYRSWVARRVAREPFAYIIGRAEFWSLSFAVGPGVLIPRPDSETLIEAVTRAAPDRGRVLRVLDIGVGSGCLLLTLLHHFPNASGIGTDISRAALGYARANAERLGVEARADLRLVPWAEGVDGPFEVIISNPPYVRHGDIAGLQPEVAGFEPVTALDGGPDGLDPYRAILRDAPQLLAPDGTLFLEIGAGQELEVIRLATPWLGGCRIHRDLSGMARCVEMWGKGS
jgi:release factor glutamine methyltransferase